MFQSVSNMRFLNFTQFSPYVAHRVLALIHYLPQILSAEAQFSVGRLEIDLGLRVRPDVHFGRRSLVERGLLKACARTLELSAPITSLVKQLPILD